MTLLQGACLNPFPVLLCFVPVCRLFTCQVKLLMVGSAGRLRAGVPVLSQLLDWVEGNGMLRQLPADAIERNS